MPQQPQGPSRCRRLAAPTMSGPSGRSPFPGRNRRRLSAEMMDASSASNSFTSPLVMSSLLSQSRTPPAASAWSPMSTRRPRRFFESDKQDGGVLATAIPSASVATAKTMDDQDGMNLAQIRAMAQNSLFGRAVASSPTTAVFYASILYAKTQSLQDAFLYAQALQANGEASRSVRLLERSGLFLSGNLEQQVEAALLAAQSLSSLGEWSEALTLLESVLQQEDEDDAGWQSLLQSMDPRENVVHPLARLCLLRGRGYDEISNPTRAAVYWKRALRIDANAVEALELLLGKSMLTPSEAYELITSLDVKLDWLRNLYLSRISVPAEEQEPPYDENQKMPAKVSIQRDMACAFDKLWMVHKLDKAPEVLALAAIRSYSQYELQASLSFCQELASIDPLCPSASFVYVATLVALDHRRLLFQLAHEWVEASPKSAWAWFAVGGYYYACGRYHVAQRHYMRATRLDPQCTQAWIAFGCAFAQCDESDQALASFRAAQRLAPAHHVPLLYMGMEYLRTNHLVLARHFLMAAHKSSGGDPLCLHELGVADYKRGEYATAAVWFHRALVASGTTESEEPVDLCQDVLWEPTLFNLGQCYRKSKQFVEAEQCFEKCLALSPGSASCFSALAFTKHLAGDVDGAIELYHQALSRKPDDPLCSEMLNRALKEALSFNMAKSEDDSQQTISFRSSPRLFSPSFLSPENSSDTRRGAQFKRLAVRQELNLSVETESNPDLSLDSDGDDIDMSMS